MEHTLCANEHCIKSREYRGGHFTFKKSTGQWFCDDCFRVDVQFDSARNLWDMTTTHLPGGERVHIRNLAHLRELEKKHGVSNHAANHMERDWNNTPSQIPTPSQGGMEGRFGRRE